MLVCVVPAETYNPTNWSDWSSTSSNGVLRAKMSSMGKGSRAFGPLFAFDGNPNSNFSGGSCMHTDEEAMPWLAIDLGSARAVTGIGLVPRNDCCIGGCN